MQRPTIIATNDTIRQIVKEEIEKYENAFDLNHIDVSKVTDMSYMFNNSEFNGDISAWDVSNVTNMSCMFVDSKFNGDISRWDVSNVTDMRCMFNKSLFNGDISQWNVSNVTKMSFLFRGSSFNSDISRWDVSNVTDMYNMFMNSKFNGDISQWDVSNVIHMENFFDSAEFNGDISKWNIHPDCNTACMLTQKEFILHPLFRIDDADAYTLRLRQALDYRGKKKLNIKPDVSKRYPVPTVIHAVYLLLSSSKPQAIHPQFITSDREQLQMLYQLTGSVYQSVVAWEQQRKLKTSPKVDSISIPTLM